jgi:hypothetical protein
MAFTPTALGSVSQIGSGDSLNALLFQKLQEKNNEKGGILGIGGGSKLDPKALSELVDLLGTLGPQDSKPIPKEPIGSGATDATLNEVQSLDPTVAAAKAAAAAAAEKNKKNGVFAEGSEILSGAATGAQLGSFGGPVGTGIGAVIGGLLGLFG